MVGAAIYDILSNDAGVGALISTRIYPDIAPQNVAYPFAIYTIDQADPSDTKDGAAPIYLMSFSIQIYSESYDTTNAIANAIRSALGAKTAGTYGGLSIQSIRFAGQQSTNLETQYNVTAMRHIYIVEQMYNARFDG